MTRGAIVFISTGSNLQQEVRVSMYNDDDEVDGNVHVSSGEWEYDEDMDEDVWVEGKTDDYTVAIVYTFKNGYGEVITTTTGFSNNQ